jgi:hypothetical protein
MSEEIIVHGDEQKPRRGRPSLNEKKATTPGWRPSSKQATIKAPHGFIARWVNADSGNIAKKRSEGWIFMSPEDNRGEFVPYDDVNDGKAVANQIRFRDMVAMMLPMEIYKQREDYYKNENRMAKSHVLKDTDNQFSQMGVQTYAPKGQSGRIVIE